MIQKTANILTIGTIPPFRNWWRKHPNFTIFFVALEVVGFVIYLKRFTRNDSEFE